MAALPSAIELDPDPSAEELAALDALCFDPAWTVRDYRAWQQQPALHLRLLRGRLPGAGPHSTEAQPLGLLCFAWVRGEAEVYRLGVHPAARRGGLGRRLLQALEQAVGDLARAEPAGALQSVTAGRTLRLWLEVRAGNAAAIALYRSEGFTEAGRRAGYYTAPAEDALVMERRLRLDPTDPPHAR